MKDGLGRRAVKRVALWNFALNLRAHRAWRRLRGERPFALGGDCRRCARCCEAPAIQVHPAFWHLPLLRAAFLWWQERINDALRRRTTQMPAARLERYCRFGAWLGGLPLVNRTLNKVVNFSAHPSWENRVCDTFDWFAPFSGGPIHRQRATQSGRH